MTLRMVLFGTALCGAAGGATAGFGAGAAGGCGAAGATVGCGGWAAGACCAGPRASAASMSLFTMRPFGPLPCTRERSSPACCAMRRASGRGEDAFAAAACVAVRPRHGCGGLGGVGRRRGDRLVRRAGGFAAACRDAFLRRAFGGGLRGRAGLRDLAAAVLGRGGLSRRWRRVGAAFRHCFAGLHQHGDRVVDLHAFGAVADQDAAEDAFLHGLDFHGGLVGLDLGDHVAGLDFVAFLFQPARERALGHGGREGGHQDVGRHGAGPSTCRSRA